MPDGRYEPQSSGERSKLPVHGGRTNSVPQSQRVNLQGGMPPNYYQRQSQPYGYFSQGPPSGGTQQMSLNNFTQPLSQSTDRASLTGFSQDSYHDDYKSLSQAFSENNY